MKNAVLSIFIGITLSCSVFGQTLKTLSYNIANGQITYSGTNVLTFTNAVTFRPSVTIDGGTNSLYDEVSLSMLNADGLWSIFSIPSADGPPLDMVGQGLRWGSLYLRNDGRLYQKIGGDIGFGSEWGKLLYLDADGGATNARSDLGLGATWLTNTNVANFRTDIGLGWSALTNTSSTGFFNHILSTSDESVSPRIPATQLLSAGSSSGGINPTNYDNIVAMKYVATSDDGTGGVPPDNDTWQVASPNKFRSAIQLGSTNSATFGSVSVGSLGTGLRQTGLDGILRFDAASLERARLTPTYQFVLLGTNGNLSFGPDNTLGASVTRTNLGLGASWLTNSNAPIFPAGGVVNIAEENVSIGNVTNAALFIGSIGLSWAPDFHGNWLMIDGALNWTYESSKAPTRTNLGLGATWLTNTDVTSFRRDIGVTSDVLTYWAAKDSADAYIASSVTGGASVIGAYGDGNVAITNPSGRGLPFYRLNVPASNPRTNSDLAAIRSSFGSPAYFAGPIRSRINWSENKNIFMRVASPLTGGGTFQFTFGETTSPAFSTNVGGQLPIPSETFIGFRLTRAGTPAYWVPSIISRSSPTSSIATNQGANMSTNAISLVNRLQLEFVAGTNPVVNLYTLDNLGTKTIVASQTNTDAFLNATNNHLVNWMMGISPTPPTGTNTVGQMQYDVEPPLIMQ